MKVSQINFKIQSLVKKGVLYIRLGTTLFYGLSFFMFSLGLGSYFHAFTFTIMYHNTKLCTIISRL